MGGWLTHLFGTSSTGVTDAVARFAGLRSASAASLFTMAGPLILGYLGRMIQREHLNAAQLGQRLIDAGTTAAATLPPGFDAPGLRNLIRRDAPKTIPAAPMTPERDLAPAQETTESRWLVPLLVLGLTAAGVLWWGFRGPSESSRSAASTVASNVVGTTGSGGMEDRLVSSLGSSSGASLDTWYAFDRIGFDTASTGLTAASRAQIDNIAGIMRAYPRARVTIGGFTDNVGDEAANMELSRARARVVANALGERGIFADRVRHEGFGSSDPVADNATEEGRARNRRVSLRVDAR
jgi:outer membrane protein OmpA-like peptidoglycan-associated protein